jgi:hypothetical protein
VFGGLNRPLAATVVAAAFLVAPSAALACNSGVSAVDVYSECLPSGGGGHPTSSAKPTSTGNPTAPQTSVTPYVSKPTAKKLKKAGRDGKSLSNLVNRYGAARFLQLHSSPAKEPTAVGSAFDLGSGPTLLLVMLAGLGVLLVAGSGFRIAQQRRR